MKRRIVLAAFATVAALSGGVMIACGGGDNSNGDDSALDSGGLDSTVKPSDAGVDTGNQTGTDTGTTPTAEAGNCTPISGPCDIVLQNCPNKAGQKQECVATGSLSTTAGTECVPTQATESLPIGRACCPSNTANPCEPGLECIGNNCSDGGPMTGRCSPHCCENDNAACGSSDPEGIAGQCNIILTDQSNDPLYYTCSYTEFCTPLGVKPCVSPDTACTVLDKNGSAQCEPYFGTPSKEHQPCGNGCADGLGCFINTALDAGDECLYFCATQGDGTTVVIPFDAGALKPDAGLGGCPTSETCTGTLDPTAFPAWLSICLSN